MDKQNNVEVGKVIAKSWSDETYKAKLMESPVEALKEMGINVPEGKSLRVVEQPAKNESESLVSQDGDDFVLNLPPPPPGFDQMIGDERLEMVAGGKCFCWDETVGVFCSWSP